VSGYIDDWRVSDAYKCYQCGVVVPTLSPLFIEYLKKSETQEQLLERAQTIQFCVTGGVRRGQCPRCFQNELVALALMRDP